ncbi:Uncharacterized conserved protein YecT, DUF1311 family [Gracilibacillus ureilyticus]|uniref:Uncharacterized conserved protein YecT, DUF1311 family n=1 Tax=Gracilibacillus ureilyticus TaxID=531814 RepID=A0A1H9V9J0_9BACI|nr:lysozyme inhibitor LprI family protein [Gracilibacillus ureilyticus]SES18249.1 Uncharacterized conserved protein YecT, DUF1311 family [Gracilibacillus ureilyticus]
MKVRVKIFIGTLLVLLVACTPDGAASDSTDQQPSSSPVQETPTNETNKEDTDTSAVSLKEEYLQKLNAAKQEMDKMQENPEDSSTYALKKIEGERFDVWDGLLNEVYGVLQDQLSHDKMEQLREEQREWIEYRDNTAKEASLQYEGGTMEQLEYVAVMNDLTEDRTFELVNKYMK